MQSKFQFPWLFTIFLVLVTGLAACSSSSDDPPTKQPVPDPIITPPKINSVSGTTLNSTDQIGQDITANSQLRKELSITLTTPDPDFVFGKLYITRSSLDSDSFSWVLSVTNNSTNTVCFLRLHRGNINSDTGSLLVSMDSAFVEGSVHRLLSASNTIYTNTCLATNQSGHFLGIELSGYSQANSVTFDSFSFDDTDIADAELTMTPTGYTVEPAATQGSQILKVTALNNGPELGVLSRYSSAILLDADDTPLRWSFLSPPYPWIGTLQAGQSGIIEKTVRFDGSSLKILVNLDYKFGTIDPQLVTTKFSVTDFSSEEEYLKFTIAEKTKNEQQKQILFQSN